MTRTAADSRWNHNTEYHRLVLDFIPASARTALDVGAGDGLLARDLASRVSNVTAIDLDDDVVTRASASPSTITWVAADFMHHPLPTESFDVVASVATLHHFTDPAAALRRMSELVAPGGALIVIGLARQSGALTPAWEARGVVTHWMRTRTRTVWEHTAPTIWPPAHSYADVRSMASAILPGANFRRLALWRYAITWTRPSTSSRNLSQ